MREVGAIARITGKLLQSYAVYKKDREIKNERDNQYNRGGTPAVNINLCKEKPMLCRKEVAVAREIVIATHRFSTGLYRYQISFEYGINS
ncbi:hypothetical protein NUACC26_001110 [Scytonema sp. NUACC26]